MRAGCLVSDDLYRLAADLDRAASQIDARVRAVVERGAHNIKTEAADRLQPSRHFPHYARSITYDISDAAGGVRADIGPDKDRPQGALGNLLEYGSATYGPIKPHLGPAIHLEEPRFVKAMESVAGDIL
jgi:hypothetical protein